MIRFLPLAAPAARQRGTAARRRRRSRRTRSSSARTPAAPARPTLRYAEDDARRVAAVLTELGGYAPDAIDVVVAPDARRAARPAREARGPRRRPTSPPAARRACSSITRATRARPRSISATTELPLAELRAAPVRDPGDADRRRARRLPERRVLARQGRAPAADFSFNSRQHLDASGIAVLASSSGQRAVAGERAAARARTSRITCSSACAARATRTTTARSRSTRPIATRITRRCSRPRRPPSAASTSRSRSTSRATARCRCRSRAPRPRRSSCRRARGPDARRGQARAHGRRRDLQGEGRRGADRGRARRVRRARAPRRRRCRAAESPRPGDVDLARCTSEAIVDDRDEGRRLRERPAPVLRRARPARRRRAPRRLHPDARRVRLQRGRPRRAAGFALTGLRQVYIAPVGSAASAGSRRSPSWKHDDRRPRICRSELDWSVATAMATGAARGALAVDCAQRVLRAASAPASASAHSTAATSTT